MPAPPDPYATLGVDRSASDAQLRAAYRRLVQLHHPDHNGGSPEAAARFELVQAAYAEALRRRRDAAPGATSTTGASAGSPGGDPDLEARLAAMERDVVARRDAREAALREARRAGEPSRPDRPSDEELGYFSTDDSLAKIVDDAAERLAGRVSQARRSPAAHRIADLIDRLTGEPPADR